MEYIGIIFPCSLLRTSTCHRYVGDAFGRSWILTEPLTAVGLQGGPAPIQLKVALGFRVHGKAGHKWFRVKTVGFIARRVIKGLGFRVQATTVVGMIVIVVLTEQ